MTSLMSSYLEQGVNQMLDLSTPKDFGRHAHERRRALCSRARAGGLLLAGDQGLELVRHEAHQAILDPIPAQLADLFEIELVADRALE